MSDVAGRTVAVCLNCDREVPAEPMQIVHCYCRSGDAESMVMNEIAFSGSRQAA